MFRTRPSVLITHIYNEEYLLPWWVKHHVTMFDKGVVIDYQSTDASLDIIRTLAPHWEIIPSTETEFDGGTCDVQVKAQERRFPDHWKMALNTTEFLCVPDMPLWLSQLERHGWEAYGIRAAVMVDPPGIYPEPPDRDTPLILQRHHGFFETEQTVSLDPLFNRCRVIHRMDDGCYWIGRHLSRHQTYIHPPGALLKYCLYSPMTPEFLTRKLQIAGQVHIKDSTADKGDNHHLLDEPGHHDRHRVEAEKSGDLRLRREYASVLFPWERRDDLSDTIDRYPAAPGFGFYHSAYETSPMVKAWETLSWRDFPAFHFFGLMHWARTELDKHPFDPILMQLLGALAVRVGVGDHPWQIGREEFLKILQDMEKVVIREPTQADLWWSLAQLRAAAGQQEKSNEARRIARLLYPVFQNTPDNTICVPA